MVLAANRTTNVLLVDDDHDDFLLTQDALRAIEGTAYGLTWVDSFDRAMEQLDRETYDVVLVDYRIGERTGLDFIRDAATDHPRTPMILLTGLGSVDIDIAAQRAGAADYLIKDGLTSELLDRSIRYACEQARRTALLKSALANAAAGMVAVDGQGTPLVWNRPALAALDIDATLPLADAGKAVGSSIAALHCDGSLVKEITNDAGSAFEMRVSPMAGEGSMIVFLDVTQRKNAETLLHQAAEAAETAARTKARFLANISHELRTPLNGILGVLRLLEASDIDEMQRGHLETMKSSSRSLLTIIDDVLDLSKVEAGQLQIEIRRFRVTSIIDDVVRLLAPTAFEKGLEIAAFVDPRLPETVATDSHRLRQVLNNLIGNAIKFASTGAITVRVEPDRMDGVDAVRFDVIDQGVGIPPDRARMLFQRFSQVDASTTRRYGGTGLGLALCREIVSLLGGRIWFTSEPGQGSTFSFILPSVDSTQGIEVAKSPDRVTLPVDVLLISDVPVLREIVSDYVRAVGGRPVLAVDLQTARSAMRTMHDPLVILDATVQSVTLQEIEQACAEQGNGRCEDVLILERFGNGAQLGKSALMRPFVGASFDFLRRRMLASARDRTQPVRMIAPSDNAGLRVLVAEDNPTNQMLMVALLHSFGHSCSVASDGREALEQCAAADFDVVIMDLNMPVMDGIEATLQLRSVEATRDLPIIGLTAALYYEDLERCRAAGMTEMLNKPVDWDHLRAVLQSIGPSRSIAIKAAS